MKVPGKPAAVGRPIYEVVTAYTEKGIMKHPWVIREAKEGNALLVGPFKFDPNVFLAKARPHEMTREMTEDEKAILMASIREHGVHDEIFVDIHGRVIDGFHRVTICCQMLLNNEEVPELNVKVIKFLFRRSELEFVLLRNLARRHLSLEDKRKTASLFLVSGSDFSDNAMAKRLMLSSGTVKALRESLEDKGVIPILPKRRGLNDKMYPVKNRKTTSGRRSVSSPFPEDLETSITPDTTIQAQDDDTPLLSATSEEVVPSLSPRQAVDSISVTTPGEKDLTDTPADTEVAGAERAMSDEDRLLETWWAHHGIEPVTSAQLVTLTGGDSAQALTALELKSLQTKIGVKLSALMKSGDNRYTIQKLQLGGQSVYYLRPAAWSKHGPL